MENKDKKSRKMSIAIIMIVLAALLSITFFFLLSVIIYNVELQNEIDTISSGSKIIVGGGVSDIEFGELLYINRYGKVFYSMPGPNKCYYVDKDRLFWSYCSGVNESVYNVGGIA